MGIDAFIKDLGQLREKLYGYSIASEIGSQLVKRLQFPIDTGTMGGNMRYKSAPSNRPRNGGWVGVGPIDRLGDPNKQRKGTIAEFLDWYRKEYAPQIAAEKQKARTARAEAHLEKARQKLEARKAAGKENARIRLNQRKVQYAHPGRQKGEKGEGFSITRDTGIVTMRRKLSAQIEKQARRLESLRGRSLPDDIKKQWSQYEARLKELHAEMGAIQNKYPGIEEPGNKLYTRLGSRASKSKSPSAALQMREQAANKRRFMELMRESRMITRQTAVRVYRSYVSQETEMARQLKTLRSDRDLLDSFLKKLRQGKTVSTKGTRFANAYERKEH